MTTRRLPANRTEDGRLEMQARRAARLSELAETLRPSSTADHIGCRGVIAESYKPEAEIEIGPLSLDDAVVILVHKGVLALNLIFSDIQYTLGMGGLVVIPAATPMTLRIAGADFTIVHLNADEMPGMPADLVRTREIVPQLDPDDGQLPMLVAGMRVEMQSGCPTGRCYFECYGLTLAVRLYELYAMKIIPGGLYRGGLTAKQVRQAKNTILTALDTSVPMIDLAEQANLSAAHFCRAFKQSTGVSPHRWRIEKRFERARDLMAQGRMTLTAIALHLGFASLSHFSSAFKRATGTPPSQYRRKIAS